MIELLATLGEDTDGTVFGLENRGKCCQNNNDDICLHFSFFILCWENLLEVGIVI
jgi:hypothetical protein